MKDHEAVAAVARGQGKGGGAMHCAWRRKWCEDKEGVIEGERERISERDQ